MLVSRICFGQWQPVKQEQNYSGYSQKKAFEKSMQQMLKESSVKEVFLTTSQEQIEFFSKPFHHNF